MPACKALPSRDLNIRYTKLETTGWLAIAFLLACKGGEAPPLTRSSDRIVAPVADVSTFDASTPPTDAGARDAATTDAPTPVLADAGARDAATPDALKPIRRTRSSREACRKRCLERNKYTDCANEEGLTACPCNCP